MVDFSKKMLALPITGPTVTEAREQVSKSLAHADLLEFRLDLFAPYSLEHLQELRMQVALPVIFTLRTDAQEIARLATLRPTYFDIGSNFPREWIEKMERCFPETTWIASLHDFQTTPDLDALLEKRPTALFKLACMAERTTDALRMVETARRCPPLLGMCMGTKGEISRLLGPVVGVPWVYSYLDAPTAPGQISVEVLQECYRFRSLSPTTLLYGLIGGQVEQSLSHLTHNRAFYETGLDALYVKMALEPTELPLFFSLAKTLGFRGLSVTSPYKEAVLPFLDEIDDEARAIGAVNTLFFQEGRMRGINTDGKAALDALEARMAVRHKRLFVLGAGGTARAIAYEALARGAEVEIFNRTPEKALKLAAHFGITGGGLECLDARRCDIFINATSHPFPVKPPCDALVLDVHVHSSPLLGKYHKVTGYEMFMRQAARQFQLWFSS